MATAGGWDQLALIVIWLASALQVTAWACLVRDGLFTGGPALYVRRSAPCRAEARRRCQPSSQVLGITSAPVLDSPLAPVLVSFYHLPISFLLLKALDHSQESLQLT